jgi:hypothetical protein
MKSDADTNYGNEILPLPWWGSLAGKEAAGVQQPGG